MGVTKYRFLTICSWKAAIKALKLLGTYYFSMFALVYILRINDAVRDSFPLAAKAERGSDA